MGSTLWLAVIVSCCGRRMDGRNKHSVNLGIRTAWCLFHGQKTSHRDLSLLLCDRTHPSIKSRTRSIIHHHHPYVVWYTILNMKGPKALLAEAISNALAEYFVIDPAQIETHLVHDAGLTLRHVQLRRRTVDAAPKLACHVDGVVASVAFTWKWGSGTAENGGSAWVNSAELKIEGLQFTARLEETTSQTVEEEAASSAETAPPTSPADNHGENMPTQNTTTTNNGGVRGYIRNQVERIIDTLRLSVADFTFTLQLPPQADGTTLSLVVGGAGIDLTSQGRVGETLTQRLSLTNLFAHVVATQNDDKPTTHTLLAPVSYQATCVRTAGKRFTGDLQRGLRVVGKSLDDGLQLHTGQAQIACLNALAGLALAVPQSSTTSAASKQTEPVESTPLLSDDEPKDTYHEEDKDEAEVPSSFLELPLAALSLVFPNGTQISMKNLLLEYQMDGKLFLVQGRDGLLVNELNLLALGEESVWEANLVDRALRVFSSTHHEDENPVVARIHARDAEIQNVLDGFKELLDIYKYLLTDASGATARASAKPPLSPPSPPPTKPAAAALPWRFDIYGDLSFLLEGPDDKKIASCRLHRIHANTVDQALTLASIQELDIPGRFNLTQPLDGTTISFDGSVFDVKIGDIVAKLQKPPELPELEEKLEVFEPSKSMAAESRLDSMESFPSSKQTSVSATSSTISDTAEKPGMEPVILPYGVKLRVQSATVYETDGETIHTTLSSLQAAVGPDSVDDSGGEDTLIGGVRAMMILHELQHDMISLVDPLVSAIVYPHQTSLVRKLHFGAKNVVLAAGYSIFDWIRLFESGDQNRKTKKDRSKKDQPKKDDPRKSVKKEKPGTHIHVPFAHIDPLKVKIKVKGELVSTRGTVINIKEFKGNENTVLHDLIKFYSQKAASSVPGMFKDAEVLGYNLTDAAAGGFGTMAGATALVGLGGAAAPAAGVLGIIGYDGIRHTIQAGKKGRGAEEDDPTNFSDFFRGIGQSAKDDAAAGAAKRGKEGQADPLDWALGFTSRGVDYTKENAPRLGGASAATVGFITGFAFGGPVVAVAGAIIAGKTTSGTIEAAGSLISKNNKKKAARKAAESGKGTSGSITTIDDSMVSERKKEDI